ncbi:MAG: mechanosensitive ion channel domain-containing protein, partial [Pseudomonadota bacterium]
MEYSVDQIGQLTFSFAIKLVIAAVVWFIGTTIAKMICDALRSFLRRQQGIDPSVANFSARALNWVMIGAIVVAILDLFNVETTGIVAVLGAATLAIGLALKDTLANFAAGVMILLFRPFATGDFIEVSGEMGTVKNINLFR